MTFSSYVDQANSRRDVWHLKKLSPNCEFLAGFRSLLVAKCTKSKVRKYNDQFRKKFSKKLCFWALHFSFVWMITDFSSLCNLYTYPVDKIFLCFVKTPIFFRTFSSPITWENRTFRKNKIESWSTKHTWTAQRCKKTKNTQESEKPGLQKNIFSNFFSWKCLYGKQRREIVPKMTYWPELWRKTCKKQLTCFWIPIFFGSKF